jgi:hypothetical protein
VARRLTRPGPPRPRRGVVRLREHGGGRGPACASTRTQLRGDVDGDGRADLVFLALDPAGRGRCRFFLVVRSADGHLRYAAPLTPWGKDVRPTPATDRQALESLHLNGLARIGGDRGLEVLLDAHQGAATQFVDVFRVWRSELRLVRAAGKAFAYSGSLGHEAGVDCARTRGEGIVVASAAWLSGSPRTGFYAVERRFSRLHGPRFLALPALTQRERVFPETPGGLGEGFTETAFPSCRTGAVATRQG